MSASRTVAAPATDLQLVAGLGRVDFGGARLPERLAGRVGEQLESFAARMNEGLLAASVAIGLEVMAEFMEAEVTAEAGPKGRHNTAGRRGYRHGTEDGSVTLSGRRVP